MRILSLDPYPFRELRYLNAAKQGGTETCRLPFVRGFVDRLPKGCDSLIIASDLQGMAPEPDGETQLLGIAVAELLEELYYDGEISKPSRCGVILAGDLYSVPEANKRGGRGDVSEVWGAFASRFAWTIGVAGNHDDFNSPKQLARLAHYHHARVLDGEIFQTDGFRFGGVSFIAGNPDRAGRRDLDDQLALIDLVSESGLDALILHEGPSGENAQPGNDIILERILEHKIPLCICGHSHWDIPFVQASPGVQILNVDARVVILSAPQSRR